MKRHLHGICTTIALIAVLTTAALSLTDASASTTPAKPAWLHIGTVHRYRDCAPHHHGAPGVFVWQKPEGNGTAALHCKNGKTFLS